MQVRARCGATSRRIKPGAGSTTSRKPKPSSARSAISSRARRCAAPPSALASASSTQAERACCAAAPSAIGRARRRPRRPSCRPAAPATAGSRPAPASGPALPAAQRCAGGSLPTCSAAQTPARTTITGARSELPAAGGHPAREAAERRRRGSGSGMVRGRSRVELPGRHSRRAPLPAAAPKALSGVGHFNALKRIRCGLAPSSPRRFFLSASYSW